MTALTSNRTDLATKEGTISAYPVKGSAHIYKGALVSLVGGYLAPALNTTGYSNVLGWAEREVNNTNTTDGYVSAPVRSGISRNVVWAGGVQAGVQNQTLYVADDQTVTTVTNGGVQAGKAQGYVSATVVRMFIPLGGM